MRTLMTVALACCMSLGVGDSGARDTKKDKMKMESGKGDTKKRELKKEEMMKDMSKGGMAKDKGEWKKPDRK